ncbi:hemagglutinin repeat-containing protein, partial [Neisseria animalis]
MNKNRYKVIFNKKRGCMVAVAENTLREGKSAQDGSGTGMMPSAKSPVSTFGNLCTQIHTLTFSVMMTLGLAGMVHASAIHADRSAPGSQQPTVLQTANGLPQINIQTPSAVGVSLNQYRQFDVDGNGAILNNSRSSVQTQSGGWIQGNPWLARGEARVIVNQINSAAPSLLNGYIEVGGRRAEVIMANPAGIQVNGAGFINAAGVTLTTGKPVFADGILHGFEVRGGNIAVNDGGLDTSSADYTRILSRAAQINAGVWAQDLHVSAGNNDITASNGATAIVPATSPAPAVAIDAGALGGMYAGKITLISTDRGAAVQNAGQIFAAAGGVTLSADGKISNSGSIVASDKQQNSPNTAAVSVNAAALDNSGTLSAQGQAAIATQNLDNSGLIASSNELSLSNRHTLNNSGHINAARIDINTGRLQNSGNIAQTGLQALALHSNRLDNDGGYIGYPQIDTSSGSKSPTAPTTSDIITAPTTAASSGSISQQPAATNLTFADGNITVAEGLSNSGSITANGSMALSTQNALSNRGELNVNTLSVSGARLDNQSGRITAQTADIRTDTFNNRSGSLHTQERLNIRSGTVDNHAGSLSALKASDIKARNLNNADGMIVSGGALSVQSETVVNSAGEIAATGNLGVHTELLNNAGGAITTARSLDLTATALNNTGGRISAAETLSLKSGELNSTHGEITASGMLTLQADDTDNTAGRISSAEGLDITTGNLNNREGRIHTAGILSLEAADLNNKDGEIAASDTVLAVADADNKGGKITAAGNLLFASANLDNSNGTLAASGMLKLNAADTENQNGIISSGSSMTLVLGNFNNNSGKIAAADLSLQAGNLSNRSGEMVSGGTLALSAKDLDNRSGTLSAAETLTLNTANLDNRQGEMAAVGALALHSAELNNSEGSILSENTLTLTAADTANRSGTIASAESLTLQTADLDNTSGEILSGSDLSLTAGNLDNGSGKITAAEIAINSRNLSNRSGGIHAGRLHIRTSGLNNSAGTIRSNSGTVLQLADGLDNNGGQITSAKDVLITENAQNTLAIQNNGGSILAGQDISLQAKSLGSDGTLAAGRDIDVQLQDSFITAQDIQAGRTLNFSTQGRLQNAHTLEGGEAVILKAAEIDNTASGIIQSDKHTRLNAQNIANRGMINSNGLTLIDSTNNLENIGSGRIYGDHIALSAQQFTNREETVGETTQAAVVAARSRLDIGATHIANREHALLFSAGDMAIGGSLDDKYQAQEKAADIRNLSASIESLGDMTVRAGTLLNRNEHFDINPRIEVGTPEAFDYIIPSGTQERLQRSDFKWVSFSRAGKLVNKSAAEYDESNFEFGRTPIPDSLIDYSADSKLWAYFGLEAPQGEPPVPNVSEQDFEADGETLKKPAEPPAGSCDSTSASYDAALCNAYEAAQAKYESDLAELAAYNQWEEANSAAFEALSAKIDAYNNSFQREIKDFTELKFTRRKYQDQVGKSDPARIASGGDMLLEGSVTNDNSEILAGKTLLGGLENINNLPTPAFAYEEDEGTTQYTRTRWRGGFKRYHQRDWDDRLDYKENRQTAIDLAVSTVLEHTSATSSLPDTPASGSGLNPSETEAATSADIPHIRAGSLVKGILPQITRIGTPNPAKASPPDNIPPQQGAPAANLPTSSLFSINPQNPGFLIETDPAFANYRQWLGSDYMLQALNQDPNHIHKRLGDGFYEQRSINEQIARLTGYRRLEGYSNDEAQFKALMDAGISYAKSFKLSLGIALSAEQVARLTSDIVWLENKTVTLPDGSVQTVLAPTVYLKPRQGDLKPGGSLISAETIILDVDNGIVSGGTIAGRSLVDLAAADIEADSGYIKGRRTRLNAANNIRIKGGRISAEQSLDLTAGNDIDITSPTNRTETEGKGFSGSNTHIGRVAGLYVSDKGGSLKAEAQGRLHLNAAEIGSAGNVLLLGREGINSGTVVIGFEQHSRSDDKNYRSEAQTSEIGSRIQAEGKIVLSGGNISTRQAEINSNSGNILLHAQNSLSLTEGRQTNLFEESRYHKSGSFASKKSRLDQYRSNNNEAVSGSITGSRILLNSGNDTLIRGSDIISDKQTRITAGGDIAVEAAQSRYDNSEFHQTKKSGLMGSGGIGFTLGSKKDATATSRQTTAHNGSTVGSLYGDTLIQSDGDYRQTGSTVSAPAGDVQIQAQNINIEAAQNTYATDYQRTIEQKGLTVAANVPVVQAVQSAVAAAKTIGKSKNDRVNAMAAANAAWDIRAADQALGQALADPKAAAQAISVSLTYGQQKSVNQNHTEGTTAQSSQINAGGQVSLMADNDSNNAHIRVTGSDIAGKSGTLLSADGITLQSAAQTHRERSSNKSSGWNAGVAVSYGQNGLAFGITAGGNHGKGYGNGDDVTHRHSHIGDADSQTLIRSSGDTLIKGAQVKGSSIDLTADNLTIESVQDTATYRSKQQNISAQATVGYGASAGANGNQSHLNADHASITEQSGIFAGDNGFNVTVHNHTELKGAIITATEKAETAGNNSLQTASLGSRNIQNYSRYEGDSIGINASGNVSGGWNGQTVDKDGNATHSATQSIGYGTDGNSQSSTTYSGIGTKNISIANDRDDTQATAAYTDIRTETAEAASGRLQNVFDKEKVQQELDLQREVSQQFSQNVQ